MRTLFKTVSLAPSSEPGVTRVLLGNGQKGRGGLGLGQQGWGLLGH